LKIAPRKNLLRKRFSEKMRKIIPGLNLTRLPGVSAAAQGQNSDAPGSAAIIRFTQATANGKVGDSSSADISGRSRSTTRVASVSGGGCLLGKVGNTVGGAANAATQTVSGVTGTAGQVPVDVTRTLGRTTGGIQISESLGASANGSTRLSAGGNDLRLEKGVTFQLRLGASVRY
jgi:hypothetical protein